MTHSSCMKINILIYTYFVLIFKNLPLMLFVLLFKYFVFPPPPPPPPPSPIASSFYSMNISFLIII